jgi:hypothetical protein
MKYAALSGARPANGAAFNEKWSKGMPHSSLSLILQVNILVDPRDPGCHIIPVNKKYREDFYHKISQEKDRQREKFLPGSGLQGVAKREGKLRLKKKFRALVADLIDILPHGDYQRVSGSQVKRRNWQRFVTK